MLKFSKPVVVIFAGIVAVGTVSFVGWYLSRSLPKIDPPRVPIDERTSLDPETGLVERSNYWDEEILSRFNEESLFHPVAGGPDAVYRFTFLPTFDKPVCIRIESTAGKHRIIVKVLDGMGGFGMAEFGKLSPAKVRDLNEGEWNELQKLIDESSFWYTPRNDRTDIPVTDGATWVLEGATDSYHLVGRIIPTPELEQAMIYMLELGAVKKDYEGYYRSR